MEAPSAHNAVADDTKETAAVNSSTENDKAEDAVSQAPTEVSSGHGTIEMTKDGKKVPYKSFRKKYLKMEVQFTAAMAKSEELYKQKLQASRVFNRLLREKS